MKNHSVQKKYWFKSLASFMLVLLMMPLGHTLMILMEHFISAELLLYCAFAMGAIGFSMVIAGAYAKSDTRQTLWGLFGGMLFWTGWVEFLFQYFANRFGTQSLIDVNTGEVITRAEYLIMPASFGFWVMVMVLYVFCIPTGCNFISWLQMLIRRKPEGSKTRNASIITFVELIMILWGSYLLLMFCYDERFLGDTHPVTIAVGVGCFIASIFIFAKQLRIGSWGRNIRMSIATVIIFWTPVEILGRSDIFTEIWVHPLSYIPQMAAILICFIITGAIIWIKSMHTSSKNHIK